MSLGSPLHKSLFDQEHDPHNELIVRKSMSLHKKALGLDKSSMHYEGSGLLGSVPHVGLQSEVLEHKFKELEKKLDKSAAGYREAIEKAQESTSEEKGVA